MITKQELDNLVIKYEKEDFIKDDPIQFPHRGKSKEDIELYGFIASLFAYGNRKMFIAKLNDLFNRADNDIQRLGFEFTTVPQISDITDCIINGKR